MTRNLAVGLKWTDLPLRLEEEEEEGAVLELGSADGPAIMDLCMY